MKQNIIPKNNKKQPHGLWIFYYPNGGIWYKGQYLNDIEHGYWIGNWTMSKSKITFFIT